MTKKYIKNCTGEILEENNSSSGGKSFGNIFSRAVFFLLLLGFLVVSGYVLFFSPYLQIARIEINGTRELASRDLQQIVESSLQGKFVGIFPRNNFLLISSGGIENLLNGNFKKIRSVTVSKIFPDSINIVVDERKALLVWCSGERCFLIDESGVAYNEADFGSDELLQNNLVRITDTSASGVSVGDKLIEPSYEQYVLSVKDALAKSGYDSDGRYWTPSRMAEEINIRTTQGMEIYFSTQFPLEDAMKAFDMVMKKEIPADKKGDMKYVDLRTENKVFYKFKDAPVENETEQAGGGEAASQTEK